MLQIKLSDIVDTPGGGKGILIQRGKGDKPRLLYLSSETWQTLEVYISTYRTRSDARALFTGRRGPVSYGMRGKIAKQIGRAAGVPSFTWHRGGHRVIDAMLDHRVPLPAIQAVAGHSKAETSVGYASRRALRTLTEREVRNFQMNRFKPPSGESTAEKGPDRVVNPPGRREWNSAGTGI